MSCIHSNFNSIRATKILLILLDIIGLDMSDILIRNSKYSDVKDIVLIKKYAFSEKFKLLHYNPSMELKYYKHKYLINRIISLRNKILRTKITETIFRVAELNEEIIGYIEIQITKNTSYGAEAGIKQGARGKGLGKKLYSDWIEVGKKLEIEKHYGYIELSNIQSQSTVQSLNFKESKINSTYLILKVETISKDNSYKEKLKLLREKPKHTTKIVDWFLYNQINENYRIQVNNIDIGSISISQRYGTEHADIHVIIEDKDKTHLIHGILNQVYLGNNIIKPLAHIHLPYSPNIEKLVLNWNFTLIHYFHMKEWTLKSNEKR